MKNNLERLVNNAEYIPIKLDYGNKLICSDCSKENFATGRWILYGAVECDFCDKRTICRRINK